MKQSKPEEINEISLKEIIIGLKGWFSFLLSKWIFIFVFGLIGGSLGFYNASNKPVNYTAKITFILEETKNGSSGLSGLASIAGQFGVDVGSGGSNGGILSADNILLYFKSPSLAREVLLSLMDSSKTETVADRYIKVYRLNDSWEKNKDIGKIKFEPLSKTIVYTRIQDSLIQKISETIINTQFNVLRPDKKASFIDVTVKMREEKLAKIYCERIVQRVVDRYINSKIQRQKVSVEKLQSRADSIALLLQQKTFSSAALQNSSNTLDINPLYRTGTNVAVETTMRDKTLLYSIFASVTQNLELAKFTLSQETPVIQIIDSPIFPLKMEKTSRTKAALLYAFIFGFSIILFFILKRLSINLFK